MPSRVIGPESKPLATSTLCTDSIVPDVPMTTASRACACHAANDRREQRTRVASRLDIALRQRHVAAQTTIGQRHATEVDAGRVLRIEAAAHAELRAAAADVDHQPAAVVGGQRVRHAEEDQLGFFLAGEYSYRMPQQPLRGFEKRIAIARFAQRGGADDRDAIERHRPQPLREARHTIETALHGGRAHRTVDRAAPELNLLLQPFERDQLAAIDARDDQVKGIRSEVESRREAVHA